MEKENSELVVLETGGKQYIVKVGSVISVEKLSVEPGKKVTLDKILLHNKNGTSNIGSPYLGMKVKAEVIAEEKDKKIRVFKFKKKTGFKKTQGHRQNYTTLKVLSIDSNDVNKAKHTSTKEKKPKDSLVKTKKEPKAKK